MTSEEYWKLRDNKRYLHYTNQIKKIDTNLKKLYINYRQELLDELKIMNLTVQAHNTKSNQIKLNKIKDNIKTVDIILDHLNKDLDKSISNFLVDNYIADKLLLIEDLRSYFKNADISFKTPNVKLVEELVRSNYWSGLTFSERLWVSNTSLKSQLKEILQAGVIKGQSYKTMANLLSQKMNSNYKDSYRLVKTELKAAITYENLDTYKKCGVEYVRSITSGKENVCSNCKKLTNRKIRVDKAKPGVNICPYHPNCTCSIIPVVSLKLQQTSDTIDLG